MNVTEDFAKRALLSGVLAAAGKLVDHVQPPMLSMTFMRRLAFFKR